MASEASPEGNTKRRRIMIITADESIIEEFEKGNKELLMQKITAEAQTNIASRSNRSININAPQDQNRRTIGSLICVVCGSSATGYNFGAIACESCKAFFRRNAFKNLTIFRCRQQGVCEITYKIRPSCPPCRLVKCFRNGMLRERIATAEQKAAKRRKLEENRSLNSNSTIEEEQSLEPLSILPDDLPTTINTDILSIPDFMDLLSPTSPKHAQSTMNPEDLQRVETISLLYKNRIELAAREGLPWDPSTPATTYIQTLNSRAVVIMRLLSFFKQIPEFNELQVDDKVSLIKYNLMIAQGMSSVLSYNAETKQVAEIDTDTPWNTQFCQLLYGHSLLTKVTKICTGFTIIAKHDEVIIQLALVIVILTNRLSTSDDDRSMMADGIAIHRAQTSYIELLWKYMEAMLGYQKTIQLYTGVVSCILSWQAILEPMRNHIVRVLSPTDVDELLPIIKSVFRIV